MKKLIMITAGGVLAAAGIAVAAPAGAAPPPGQCAVSADYTQMWCTPCPDAHMLDVGDHCEYLAGWGNSPSPYQPGGASCSPNDPAVILGGNPQGCV
jgi:hypothetical protein